MRRFTISMFDTIPNPNATETDRVQRLKRYVLYDHMKNKIVSQPITKDSPEYFDLLNDYRLNSDHLTAEFHDYNIALQEYLQDINLNEDVSNQRIKRRIKNIEDVNSIKY